MRLLACAALAALLAGCDNHEHTTVQQSRPAARVVNAETKPTAPKCPRPALPTIQREHAGKNYKIIDRTVSYNYKGAYITATVEGDGMRQIVCSISQYSAEIVVKGRDEWELFDKYKLEHSSGWVCHRQGTDGKVDSFRIGNKSYPVEGYGSNLAMEQKAQELFERYASLMDVETVRAELVKQEKQQLDDLLKD